MSSSAKDGFFTDEKRIFAQVEKSFLSAHHEVDDFFPHKTFFLESVCETNIWVIKNYVNITFTEENIALRGRHYFKP